MKVWTSAERRVSRMKEEVSSCSGERRMIRRNLRSFFARSRAWAYPPSKNGRVLLPYSSSNSRFNRKDASLGFKDLRPAVLALLAAPAAVAGRKALGRNGNKKENSPNDVENNLYSILNGAKRMARRKGGRRTTSSSACGTIRGAVSDCLGREGWPCRRLC